MAKLFNVWWVAPAVFWWVAPAVAKNIDTSPALTQKLLDSLTKISTAAEQSAIRRGELVPKRFVLELAGRIVSVVTERLQGIPDYEEIVDDIVRGIRHEISTPPRIEEN